MRTKFNGILTLIFALTVQFVFAQKTVSGTVSDESGPLPGVNILVKGTKTGTETDFEGKYSLKAKEGDILVFSYVGYASVEKTVGAAALINVTMQGGQVLEEVVVVGYGTQKRSEVTSSISKINGSEIANIVAPSFESQIAGKASGVQITTSSGIIGEVPRIRIRGVGSINSGTYPLIIVDGMPVYTQDIGGYANTNAMADINPSDIESFEVLKDGAATAIYGSRAANGVIIITTKKGKKGTMKVAYNNTFGFAMPVKTFDLLNTKNFLTISAEKTTNAGVATQAVGADYDTDWQAAVLKESALQVDHNFSLNGGTDKTIYYFSLGYTKQDGVAVSNKMNRLSMRTNLEHSINNWLKVGGSLSLTRSEYDGLNTGSNSLSGIMFNVIRQLPNTPIYNANHPTGYNLSAVNASGYYSTVGQGTNATVIGDNITNIVYVLDHNKLYSKINRTLANVFASADIYKGLNYRLQASVDNPLTGGFLYWDPLHGDGGSTKGRLQNNNTEYLRWNIQNIINYNKSVAEKHNFGFTGVVEYQKEKNQSFYGVGLTLLDSFYNQNLVTGSYATQQSGGGMSEVGLMSYIARLNYNYNQKYFLQGSIRRDGLSKFSPDLRWHNFIGYSAGWNVAREEFFEPIKNIINDFKFRASYSEVGNVDVPGGSYPYLSLTAASPYTTENGLAFSQLGNDKLTWETSNKFDFGVDLGFFNNKLKFNFDYYKNEIDGLVLQAPTLPSLGIPNNNIVKNIGNMYNKGLEFGVGYAVFEKENFKWNVDANFSTTKNVVTATANHQIIFGGTSTDPNITPNIIIKEGESINSLFGYQYWGVNPANGNPVYYKADGSLVQGNISANYTYFVFDPNNPSDMSTTASLTSADRVVLGNTVPTYFGSVTNKLNYKNFDFSVFVRFGGGNKIFNATRRELLNQNFSNNGSEILGRWQSVDNPGDGWTPRLWAASNTTANLSGAATSRFVENGDFISLDNVTFGYSLPKAISERVRIDNLRLFVQAQNAVIITKYKGLNPEMEINGVDLNGTPRAQIWSMGLNINL